MDLLRDVSGHARSGKRHAAAVKPGIEIEG
jgi:hypothetical protein